MEADIERQITEALKRVPASAGDNLLGFQMDMDYGLLDARDILRDVEVCKIKDDKCLLAATATAADADVTVDYVAKRLEELWLGFLRYGHWEAHSVEKQSGQVVLRSVTTTGNTECDICVTGRITVSGLRG